MGWTPLYILPFGVELGFLMSLEMSFPLWFFYLFWKGEQILGKAMGLQNLPGFPYALANKVSELIPRLRDLRSIADVDTFMRF